MNIWSELYLGVVIGLSWSCKSLLSTLPCNKVPFFCSCLALYYALGGFSYGKFKLAIGLLTFLAFSRGHQLPRLLLLIQEPCARIVSGLSSLAAAVVAHAQPRAPPQKQSFW